MKKNEPDRPTERDAEFNLSRPNEEAWFQSGIIATIKDVLNGLRPIFYSKATLNPRNLEKRLENLDKALTNIDLLADEKDGFITHQLGAIKEIRNFLTQIKDSNKYEPLNDKIQEALDKISALIPSE